MKKIEEIIYETARNIINIEEKIKLSSIFLFFLGLDDLFFSELLYGDISIISKVSERYNIDLYLNFEKIDILNTFNETRKKVIEIYDENAYYKALFEKEEFAIVCYELSQTMKKLNNKL